MFKRIHILMSVALFAGTLVATPFALGQTTWYVDDDAPNDPGPGDPAVSDPLEDGSIDHPFDAIQEGIDAADPNDTVLVLDGTYTGTGNRDLDYAGRAITVRSENGPENCIIDCEGDPNDPHRGFHFHSAETGAALVRGLTITAGNVPDGSGGGPPPWGVCRPGYGGPCVAVEPQRRDVCRATLSGTHSRVSHRKPRPSAKRTGGHGFSLATIPGSDV